MKFVEQTEWKWLPIRDLRPNPANSNKHSDEQIERLVKLIKYYGWRQPIIISNRSGLIAAGHARLLAAKAMGMSEVPVQYQNFEDDDEERGFLVADNSIAAWAELDLSLINAQMGDFDPGFDLDLLGIKDFTLDMADKEFGSGEDEVPEAPPEPVVKRGELWILGEHRLLIDDCTVKENVERLMAGEKADMVFTDPPYNIGFVPQRGTHEAIQNDDMPAEKFMVWLRKSLENMKASMKENSYAFVWSCWSTTDQFLPVLRESLTVKAMPVWVKNNFGIGYYSRPKYEPFFLCLNGEPEKPDPAPADVWEHAKVSSTVHSCEKPVGLIVSILNCYDNSGKLVLDAFLGSGSTLIACEKTNRRCFGMEIDPHYGQVIIERYIKFTGRKDVYRLEANGHKTPWSEVAPKHSP